MEQRLLAEPLTPRPAARGQAPRLLRRADRARSPTACRSRCATCARSGTSAPSTRWSTPAPPSSRPRRRTSTAPTRRRTRRRRCPATKALVIGSGPIRIGQGIEFDYSRRARRLGAAGGRLHGAHRQLQPRDGLDRLRHHRPPLLRAAGRGVAARHPRTTRRPTTAPRPARSSSSAARPRSTSPSRSHRADAPILGSSYETIDLAEDRRRFEDFLQRPRHPAAARRRRRTPSRRRCRRRSASATRCSCARATCSAAARWRSSRTPRDLVRYVGAGGASSPQGKPDPHRQVPRGQRGRGRRDLRRRATC